MNERILVVDDDESILRSISLVLRREGYEVESAKTAKDALDKLKKAHFDLALVDIWLPDMKGTELLEIAKKELEGTVKIVITGYPSGEAGARARDVGADAFVLKPVKMPDLISIVRILLSEEESNPYLSEEEKKMSLEEVNNP